MGKASLLEIACFNYEAAVMAQRCGADRIELCEGFEVGGTTPSLALVKKVRNAVALPLYVMIRPRGGDFVYTDEEFEQMKKAIQSLKNESVNGFVFGILHPDQSIDKARNQVLVDWAQPFSCTFHRAFDEVKDPAVALEDIIECGFTTVLTAGQSPNVSLGVEPLAKWVKQAQRRIAIMPGGGLRSTNITSIRQLTQAHCFHSSAITQPGQTADPEEIRALKSNLLAADEP